MPHVKLLAAFIPIFCVFAQQHISVLCRKSAFLLSFYSGVAENIVSIGNLMRLIISSVLFGLLTAVSHAAEAPKYGILSLAGGNITVMSRAPQTGARLTGYNRQVLQNTSLAFDETAIRAVSDALQQRHPGAASHLMLTQDRELYTVQNAMFEQPAAQAANRSFMASLWQGKDVSHVILVTVFRTELELSLHNSHEGVGTAEGLGFFMDNDMLLESRETGNSSRGLLMPFAYLKVRVLDARTLDVLAEEGFRYSTPVIHKSGTEESLRAWQALTPEEKVDYLNALIRQAMTAAVPKVLAQAGL